MRELDKTGVRDLFCMSTSRPTHVKEEVKCVKMKPGENPCLWQWAGWLAGMCPCCEMKTLL